TVDQCLAAGLPAGVRAQLSIKRRELQIERGDHRKRDRDLLTRGLGQRQGSEPLAAVALHQLPRLRAALAVGHRLNPLLPPPALLAGLTRARLISPLATSIHSAVICARCWSTPITIDIKPNLLPPAVAGSVRPLRPIEYVGRRSVPSVERPAARAATARAYLC